MVSKQVRCSVVLSTLLGVACGGTTVVHEGDGVGGAFGAGESGGSSSWGGSVSFAGGAAGATISVGSGGAGGQGFLVPPKSPDPPPDPCPPSLPAQVRFSRGSDLDAGRPDGGAMDAGTADAGTPLDAGAMPCFVNIPDYPPGDVFDPKLVNVSVISGSFTFFAYGLASALACHGTTPGTFKWYYDDPVKPTRIAFCADTCQEFHRGGIEEVTIVRGCGGPRPVL